MILSDREIIERVEKERMIDPFVNHQVSDEVVSYGLSSYGYDMRIANTFKVVPALVNLASMPVLDPKAIDENLFEDVVVEDHGYIEIPANSFVLGHSVEYFRIPRDIMGLCLGKSTYARSGVTVHITPLEAGWQGIVTIEVANNAPVPVRVYANEGIAQVLFLKPNKPSLVSYADRKGKYQNQVGITLPKILG